MIHQDLGPLEILNGALSIGVVIIAVICGVIIISKYFEFKRREFLLIGITAIILVEPWWPSALSTVLLLIFNIEITEHFYFFLGNAFIPVGLIGWSFALTDLIFEKQKKILQISGILYGVAFEMHFLYAFFFNISSIGQLRGPNDVEYHYVMTGFLFSVVIFVFTTGLLFAKESLKADNPEIQLRGKLLVYGFSAFAIGATLDALIPLSAINLLITRFILISCAIGLYGGFIMPQWIRKLFLRE